MFEPKKIPTEQSELILLPCHFSYVDGVIERVQFLKHDEDWSKNIKRAALNMIQVKLNEKNGVQGYQQTAEEMNNRICDDADFDKAITIPEVYFLSNPIKLLKFNNSKFNSKI